MTRSTSGAAYPKVLAQALRGLTITANQEPQLTRVFSTFSATNPSIYLNIDRNKAEVLGVQLNDVFQALQASLGDFYVNDINLFGRMNASNVIITCRKRRRRALGCRLE